MPTGQFSRELTTSAPPEEVWDIVTDVDRLVSWVSVLDEAQEHEHLTRYSAVLADRLGPFRLRADLAIEVLEAVEGDHIVVRAAGEDRQVSSRISVEAELRLFERDGVNVMAVDGTYEVAGRVATMGASTITKKAEIILEEFFGNAAEALA